LKEKIASVLLVCLVILPFINSCSSIALFSHATHHTDVTPSEPTILTQETCQNVKPTYPKPNLGVLGDPIDDPKPR